MVGMKTNVLFQAGVMVAWGAKAVQPKPTEGPALKRFPSCASAWSLPSRRPPM
jgi:hypothetical protein